MKLRDKARIREFIEQQIQKGSNRTSEHIL